MRRSRPWSRSLVALATLSILASLSVVPLASAHGGGGSDARTDTAILFAADGLRQDLVQKYADQGVMPTMRQFLRSGVKASGNGMLTQAPPNTGAGWYTLATGAWPGVHGSTNNTFHKSGPTSATFGGTRVAAFDSGVLQAETIAQSAERGGLKVAQVEWAGGRNASISGPTIDFQGLFSGRGVTTNFIGTANDPLFDDAPFISAFGLQFDHPAGYAGQAPFPGAAPAPASGWTNVPTSYSPAMEMRMRVLDSGTDKYGLDAYLYDSKDDAQVRYDRVLFAPTKDGATKVGDLRAGQWADVKVKLIGGTLAGMTAGFLVKVETLSADLSRVRLFHTSVSRANATWAGFPGEGGISDFAEFLAQKFPTSTAADFAVLEAGVVSEETYAQQGLYWATGHQPMLEYVVKAYKPDLLLAGYPTTDEFQHQFLGLVTRKLPNGQPNPAYDDVTLDGVRDGRVDARSRFIRDAYKGADRTLALARKLMGKDPTTFVASDHGFAPQFLAVDASRVLVDLGLLSAPQVSNCRTAAGETIGKAKACWAGGTVQIYLNVTGRDNAGGLQQIASADVDATVAKIKAAFLALTDPNDWTHDGAAEGWKVIDRAYTRAEARYIPVGGGQTADMAHPTRTGDLVVFSYPPYQFDAATPGTLVAPSHFFGQHGYVPDVQNLGASVNMRATFLAGGRGITHRTVTARSIDLAPTLAYLLGVPEPQQSQGTVLLKAIKGSSSVTPVSIIGLNDFHGQLDPTTMSIDGVNVLVGGGAYLGTMFREEDRSLPGAARILAGGDNVGASPPNSGLLEDMPAIDVENTWGLDATSYGNHEFDYGVERLLKHQARADFPFLATNIVETATGKRPSWVRPSVVLNINGVRVGVIGAGLETTPELVSAGATEGLTFLPAAPALKAESERLRKQGIRVQVVVIHEGTSNGLNAIGATPSVPWDGPIVTIAQALQSSTVDAIIAGHTHRVSNTMVGDILVTEGVNAGATYSALQLLVRGGDVEWAGGATRVAKTIGVAPEAAAKAIIDQANAETAVLRNKVIGTQSVDIKRDPARLSESAMGNLVADAMREKYPGVDAALANSGGLRADINITPPSASEKDGEVTWGEVFAVLPFGNRTVIATYTGAQFKEAMLNGASPNCDPAIHTGRTPQLSGLRMTFTCNGTTPVITGLWLTPQGIGGPETPVTDTTSIRLVINDFVYTGGDGYTALMSGADVQMPGDDLMELVVSYVGAHSPVSAKVEGRVVKQ